MASQNFTFFIVHDEETPMIRNLVLIIIGCVLPSSFRGRSVIWFSRISFHIPPEKMKIRLGGRKCPFRQITAAMSESRCVIRAIAEHFLRKPVPRPYIKHLYKN
jgi:hypothetical protein